MDRSPGNPGFRSITTLRSWLKAAPRPVSTESRAENYGAFADLMRPLQRTRQVVLQVPQVLHPTDSRTRSTGTASSVPRTEACVISEQQQTSNSTPPKLTESANSRVDSANARGCLSAGEAQRSCIRGCPSTQVMPWRHGKCQASGGSSTYARIPHETEVAAVEAVGITAS